MNWLVQIKVNMFVQLSHPTGTVTHTCRHASVHYWCMLLTCLCHVVEVKSIHHSHPLPQITHCFQHANMYACKKWPQSSKHDARTTTNDAWWVCACMCRMNVRWKHGMCGGGKNFWSTWWCAPLCTVRLPAHACMLTASGFHSFVPYIYIISIHSLICVAVKVWNVKYWHGPQRWWSKRNQHSWVWIASLAVTYINIILVHKDRRTINLSLPIYTAWTMRPRSPGSELRPVHSCSEPNRSQRGKTLNRFHHAFYAWLPTVYSIT